jgi:hypothetical protein
MSKPGTETILGSYVLFNAPDGQVVPMEQLSDGSWVTVASRINREDIITDTFKSDTFKANRFEPQTDSAIELDHDKIIERYNSSQRHLDAWLVRILGLPERIKTKSDIPRINPAIKELVVSLIGESHMPKWMRIKELMEQ